METLKLKKKRQERLVTRCAIEFVVNGQICIGLSNNISLGGLLYKVSKLPAGDSSPLLNGCS